MADFSFINDERWFNEAPETKSTMLDNAFARDVASDERFANETPETQALMRENYNKQAFQVENQSEYNPRNVQARLVQDTVDRQSFTKNMWDQTQNSFMDLFDSVQSADDLATGNFDSDYGERTAKTIARRKGLGTPRELKAFTQDFAKATKEYSAAKTLTEKAKAVFGSVDDVAREVINNPKGAAYLSAQSISSLGSSLAGGWTGAKTGAGLALAAQASPLGAIPLIDEALLTAAGGITGMFMSNLPMEAQSKFMGYIENTLAERGLEPTAENIDALVADAAFRKPALKKARTKAVVTSGTDALTSLLIGAAGSKALRGAKTLGGKAAVKAGQFAGETLGEPLSEGLGAYAADGKVELGELLAETVGGLGMAPVSTAVDQAIFAGDVSKEVATKKFKEVMAGKSEEHKKDLEIQKADRTANYKQEVKDLAKDGDITNLTDPEHKEYNPVKAVQVLAEREDEASYDEMVKTKDQYILDTIDIGKRLGELQGKEGITDTEKAEAIRLNKQYDTRIVNVNKIKAAIAKKDKLRNDSINDIKAIDPVKSKSEDIVSSVTKSLGSHGRKNAVTNQQISDTLKKRKDLPTDVKEFLTDTVNSSLVRDEVNTHARSMGKSLNDVRGDIYKGSTGFKGIDNYHMAIAKAVETGNTSEANKALAGLKKFERSHNDKAQTVRQILTDVQAGNKSSPEVLAQYEELQNTKGSNLNIHKNSDKLVKAIELDAKALSAAVKVANSMIVANTAKSSTEASTPTKTTESKKEINAKEEEQTKNQTKKEDSKETATAEDEKVKQDNTPATQELSKPFKSAVKRATDKQLSNMLSSYKNDNDTARVKYVESEIANRTKKVKSSSVVNAPIDEVTVLETEESLEALRKQLGNAYSSKQVDTSFNKISAQKRKVSDEVIAKGITLASDLTKLMGDNGIRFETEWADNKGELFYSFTLKNPGKETTYELTKEEFNAKDNLKILSKRIAKTEREYAKQNKTDNEKSNGDETKDNRSEDVSGDTISEPKQQKSIGENTEDAKSGEGVVGSEGKSSGLDFDKIPVTVTSPDGKSTEQVAYDKAIADINEELGIYRQLLKCVKSK